jgi:formylglycine-generating enzyme required for sulfatase activity
MNVRNLLFLWLLTLTLISPVYAEQYAFLVGVRDYSLNNELSPLQYSENDVQQLATTLEKSGVATENITLMTQANAVQKARYSPTSRQIRKELAMVLSELKAGDTIIVGFSGHGLQFKNDPVNYFCPSDARLDDKSTLISLTQVYEDLEKSAASGKVLLVDACRNDPVSSFRKSPKVIQLESVSDRKAPVFSGGTVALFSCSATQYSFEHKDLENGVFFHFVNRAFAGEADLDLDKTVDLFELEGYAIKNVQKWTRVNLGEMQTPERRGNVRGVITLIDLDVKNRAKMDPMPSSSRQDATPKSITNSIGMKLNLIPAGTFMMGSPTTEKDRDDDELQHRVTLTRDYYMGTTEVTQGQWEAVMGTTTPWRLQFNVKEGTNFAVSCVSWNDAIEFCKKLSVKEGRTYRLPTEAEWEYACRGGTTSAYSFGDAAIGLGDCGWFDENTTDNGEKYAHEVGLKRANGYGLYDMHGNVWEWCSDWEGDYASGSVSDPQGPSSGSLRVSRGGGWDLGARYFNLGFRVAVGR